MKNLIFLLSTFFLSIVSVNEDPIERLGIKGPLEFNKVVFKLAWTDQQNNNFYVQEYLPDGEKLESFNQMLTVNLLVMPTETQQLVQQKIKELEERKKTDPLCNYVLNESPDGKELMLDFLLGVSKDNKMTTVEFNIYRYQQVELKDHKKAILLCSYSKRSYGSEITPFLKVLGEGRGNYLNQMIGMEMPNVKL